MDDRYPNGAHFHTFDDKPYEIRIRHQQARCALLCLCFYALINSKQQYQNTPFYLYVTTVQQT